MKDFLLTLLHLAVITAKLSGPGGVRAVIAENLVLKQQLIVLCRGRRRAPRLTLTDRLLCGFGALFLSPGRIRKVAIALRPSTLLAFHQALVRGKYRRLFSSAPCPTKPGPKGPDKALIQAIVELKSRNPRFGCPRIARIISRTFGVDVDKNVVHRVLAKHYRPTSGGSGPLMVIVHRTHHGQPLERRPLSMRVHRAPELLGARGDGPIHASPRRSRRAQRSGQRR
jgi:putative transposase